MTKDDPVNIGIFKLVGRDFTSEGSRGSGEAVLGRDLGWGLELGLNVEEVDCWGCYDDLCLCIRIYRGAVYEGAIPVVPSSLALLSCSTKESIILIDPFILKFPLTLSDAHASCFMDLPNKEFPGCHFVYICRVCRI